ncbi:hypothetical protein SeJ_A0724 [Salmonella enterica subsp. enterica serovar Javiana str. GA_MM04042433]|nr:hypothetical protein SeJ_A0724 [Salmonella enterica subsp. enterica serovar Javiana str. GA_MM04042433]
MDGRGRIYLMSHFFILKNMMHILSKVITENLFWGTVKKILPNL